MNPDTSEPSAERQAFEAAMRASKYRQYELVWNERGYYEESGTQRMWNGWKLAGQARAGAKESQPVAWQERQARRVRDGVVIEWSKWYECKPRSPSGPLAFTDPDDRIPREWRPLYTHSGAPQPVGPLTDSQIAKCMLCVDDPLLWGKLGECQGDMLRQFARAIEKELTCK